ncbi:MAG: AAA family ATPase [Candidatus Gastranaerophilaceae bacterium]|jgi:DNA transposition AAA+ family ATPase
MKKVFVKTNNVKRFITMMNNLQNRAEGVPGMALVYGEPGLGKTQTINWWAFKNNAILVRCTQLMSARWLLSEILEEMGEIYGYKISDCFKLVVRNLLVNPQIIIIDEVDYLTVDSRAVETLRDIHDKTNVPIVLVGMINAKSRLKKFNHLYDRLSEIVKFEKFSKTDIKTIVQELSEVEMTECAIRYIYTNLNRFRQIVKVINKAEIIAKANGLNSIDEILIKEAIANETENIETNQES